jgi:hypothetical protein
MGDKHFYCSVEHTKKFGIIQAAIIGRVLFWCDYNHKNKIKDRYYDNYWWSGFMSAREFSEQTGISQRTIEKNLVDLIKNGVLVKGVYNKKGFDKTGWYRVTPSTLIECTIYPERVDDVPLEGISIYPEGVNRNTLREETIPDNLSVKQNDKQTIKPPVNPPVNSEILEQTIKDLTKIILDELTLPEQRWQVEQERMKLEQELETLTQQNKRK